MVVGKRHGTRAVNMATSRLIFLEWFLFCFASAARHSPSLNPSNGLPVEFQNMQACNVSWNQLRVGTFRSRIVGRSTQLFDFSFSFLSPLQKPSQITAYVNKCSGSSNACDRFATWKFGEETCALLKQEHAIWTPSMKQITPAFHCPIPANVTYSMRNGSWDMNVLKAFNLRTGQWNIDIIALNEHRNNYACANLIVKSAAKGDRL